MAVSRIHQISFFKMLFQISAEKCRLCWDYATSIMKFSSSCTLNICTSGLKSQNTDPQPPHLMLQSLLYVMHNIKLYKQATCLLSHSFLMSKGVMKAFGLLEKSLEGAGFASMKQYGKVLKNRGNGDLPGSTGRYSGLHTLPLPARPVRGGQGTRLFFWHQFAQTAWNLNFRLWFHKNLSQINLFCWRSK